MTSVLPSQQIFAQHGIDPATLRWTGQPCSGLLFRRSDVYFIPISVIFFSIGVFAESTAIMSRDPIGRGFAAVFVVIGAYLLFGRFIWDAYARSKTYYGLTSDSAIIVRAGSSSAQRIYLPAVQQLGFTLSANGSGTISFGDSARSLYWYPNAYANWAGGPLAPSFEGIPDARHVYDLCVSGQHVIN